MATTTEHVVDSWRHTRFSPVAGFVKHVKQLCLKVIPRHEYDAASLNPRPPAGSGSGTASGNAGNHVVVFRDDAVVITRANKRTIFSAEATQSRYNQKILPVSAVRDLANPDRYLVLMQTRGHFLDVITHGAVLYADNTVNPLGVIAVMDDRN